MHFKGFTSKWDMKINLTDPAEIKKILPVGAMSKGNGWAKKDVNFQNWLQDRKKTKKSTSMQQVCEQ